MNILLQIVIGIFIADFMVAFFHWLEDALFDYCIPIPVVRLIAKENLLHHYFPRTIVTRSYCYSCIETIPITLILLALLYLAFPKVFTTHPYMIIAAAVVGITSNLLHKFAHMRDCECPRIILAMQKVGILVGHEHHAKHHKDPTCKYGVITPITNYICDGLAVWRIFESFVYFLIRIKPSHKMPYEDTIKLYGATDTHANAKQECPPRATFSEIEELSKRLKQYHACPV